MKKDAGSRFIFAVRGIVDKETAPIKRNPPHIFSRDFTGGQRQRDDGVVHFRTGVIDAEMLAALQLDIVGELAACKAESCFDLKEACGRLPVSLRLNRSLIGSVMRENSSPSDTPCADNGRY